MHKHRYKSTLWAIKLAALHFIINAILITTALGTVICGCYYDELQIVYMGLAVGAGWVVSALLLYLRAAKLRCPLCMVPIFANKRCGKSKSAKKILRSYRLAMSLDIVFTRSYRCIYCGESFDTRHLKDETAAAPTTPRYY